MESWHSGHCLCAWVKEIGYIKLPIYHYDHFCCHQVVRMLLGNLPSTEPLAVMTTVTVTRIRSTTTCQRKTLEVTGQCLTAEGKGLLVGGLRADSIQEQADHSLRHSRN